MKPTDVTGKLLPYGLADTIAQERVADIVPDGE
jgi:hypothetical protein